MMRCLRVCLMIIFCTLSPVLAWADGPTFNGPSCTIGWTANTEADLAGYRLYDRTSLVNQPTLIASFGLQITSVTCASLGLNPGQHYISLTAFDTSGNESGHSNVLAFVIVVGNQVTDLRVTVINATDVTLAFTEPANGNGTTYANYDVRLATPTMQWGSAASVTSGTCSTATGGTVGATKTCTATGLSATTPYQFQLVPYDGIQGAGATFAPLSNIATATTGGTVAAPGLLVEFTDAFTRADTSDIGTTFTPIGGANLEINSNAVRSPVDDSVRQELSSTVVEADHYGQITLSAWSPAGASTEFDVAVTLRTNAPGTSMYQCNAVRQSGGGTKTVQIIRTINSSNTELASATTPTWAASDTLRCTVETTATGEVIAVYRNSGATAILTYTDTSASKLTSGQSGILTYIFKGGTGTLDDMKLDDWQTGNFDRRYTYASDAFTRADASVLGNPPWHPFLFNNLGGPVSANYGLGIVSNHVETPLNDSGRQEIHDGVLPSDQWAEFTVTNWAPGNTTSSHLDAWAAVRATLDGLSGYHCEAEYPDDTVPQIQSQIIRWINGVRVVLATAVHADWANNDVALCLVKQDVISFYKNRVLVARYQDATHATGYAGLGIYMYKGSGGALNNIQLDNWNAGGFVAAAAGDPCGCDSH